MSVPEQPGGSSKQYRDIHINDGARAQLGDIYYIGREDPLSLLPFATNAPFNSYDRRHEPACLPETRVDLLQEIYNWADGTHRQDGRCIFWLNGLAGTGKSTVARTVARRFAEQNRLGASFFFSKGSGDISNAGKFFTSLAVQLTFNVPSLRQSICEAVTKRRNIASLSLPEQWRQLVLSPISNLQSESCQSYILVVDALDECEDDKDVQIILQLLAEARSLTTVRLRVLFTSRPEIPIRYSMRHILQAEHQDFILHNVPATIVNHDISLLLEYNLGIIRQEWTLGADWPGEVVLRQLVLCACGLFIWAATACRFIREGRRFARKRLDIILKGSSSAITAPEKHLNEIYLAVLEHSISSGYSKEEKEEACNMLKHTLGSIVVLLSPLSASSLSRLLHLPKEEVDQTFEDLYAILDIPGDPTYPVRLHHPSFRDFLLNKDRCGDFWVDNEQAHRVLADSCIQLLSETLKKDICEMQAPGSLATQIDSNCVEKWLPSEVQYACLYWVQHLQRSSAELSDNDQVHQFLQAHILHWLEALSWIGKISEGIVAIHSLEALIPATKSPNIYALTYDIKRFALYNRSLVEQYPLQLYCSALIFAPEKSIVRRSFEEYIPAWIQKRSKATADWNRALQTLEGHFHPIYSVAFSPDSKQVVSGSWDKTVRLWDAVTGASLQILEGHSSTVSSVAFSPDGKQVVSGSWDKTVRLWDAVTGASLQTLKGYFDCVESVAFSPDGKQIVSGSRDKTVRLWDAVTGASLHTLSGHFKHVYSVAFSPDGKQVVSGSSDKTVRLWDSVTGASVQTLCHPSSVSSVAFSPGGKQVVSSSSDSTVRLWDTVTGALLQTLKGHSNFVSNFVSVGPPKANPEYVYSVAFSPDGKQVVSGSGDETVQLWDTATGTLLQTLEGHSNSVRSVAFSPDGKQVVSGSEDGTVRLWDIAIIASLQTLEGHSSFVSSVAFSSDGKHVISGSRDETIRLWDVTTGVLLQTLESHSSTVNSVVFSSDGKQIVSGSSDNTVRLWDVATGVLLQTLEGHSSIVNSAVFSPDNKQIVSGSWDETVRLWDTATGALLQTLKGRSAGKSNNVSSVAFSPDGKQVVSGSWDEKVRLWEAATGKLLQTLEGHSNSISSVAFSPDGKQIVSSSWHEVRLWDAVTGTLIQTLEGHFDSVRSLAFSPDGKLQPTLLVSKDWVVEGTANILWLPPDYRSTCTATWNQSLVLGHSSGSISLFRFTHGPKLITCN